MIVMVMMMMMIGMMTTVISFVASADDFDPQEDILCWTCDDRASNEECNQLSPLIPCPRDQRLCKNVHTFDTRLKTVTVTKTCANQEQCRHLDCHGNTTDGSKVCSTCCDFSMCNKLVATDPVMAFNLTYIRSHSTFDLPNLFFLASLLAVAEFTISKQF